MGRCEFKDLLLFFINLLEKIPWKKAERLSSYRQMRYALLTWILSKFESSKVYVVTLSCLFKFLKYIL